MGHLTAVFVFYLSLGLFVQSYQHGRYRNQQIDTFLKGATTSVIDNFERSLSAKNIGTGIKHNQFEWSCGLVRGLRSTLPFRRGDTVVQLPVVEAIVAPDAVGKSGKCPKGMDDVWIASSVTVRVALQLLKEWKEDSASPYAAYIGALPLPGEFGTPLHWPQSVLDQFPYPYLSHSVDNQKRRLIELYETRIAKSKVFQGISYERFVWAVEVVGSRAFKGIGIASSSFPLYGGISAVLVSVSALLSSLNGIPDFLPLLLAIAGTLAPLPAVLQAMESNCVLLPAIDSCNHRGNGAICDIALDPSKGSFVMQASRDVNAGEELTITYGEKHNDDLLQYFGFLELDCAFDRYVVEDPIATLRQAIAARMVVSSSSGNGDYSVPLLEAMDRLVQAGLTRQKGIQNSGSPVPLIITRAEGVSSKSLGDLTGVLDLGSGVDSVVAKQALMLLMQSERQRIEDAMSNGCLTGLQSAYEQCVARKFLHEKQNVLDATINKLGSR